MNKGFTPRMMNPLEEKIHETADEIIDAVIEKGEADFVTDISAELPLQVIADLLGVPQADRHNMFDWSNRMIGQEDPEFQTATESEYAGEAAIELLHLRGGASSPEAGQPPDDLMSVLVKSRSTATSSRQLELELFFLLLTVAGNETTRNLMSGAMHAFFEQPRPVAAPAWPTGRSCPTATDEMLRYVTPVMNFRRQTTGPVEIRRPAHGGGPEGGLLPHLGQP